MRRLLLPILCALVLAACGGSSKSEKTAAPTKTAKPTATATPAPVGKVKVTGALGAKPAVVITPINATPPAKLEIKDLAKGHGSKKARAGDMVTVQYYGVLYANGTEFDASWDRGQPFSFPLGAGQVIPGWDKGLIGMKVGGQRVLTIPPNLAYGPQGQGPIPPNATLVFVVDMLKIKR
jgi:peptidylprolyl isomerase